MSRASARFLLTCSAGLQTVEVQQSAFFQMKDGHRRPSVQREHIGTRFSGFRVPGLRVRVCKVLRFCG